MTRLKTDDIKDIVNRLEPYDMELFQKTGCTLRGIACHAFAIPEQTFQSIAASVEVGVVPFQSGQGIIEGFSNTLKHIVKHIGFKAFITKHTDVAGIAEAVEKNAEVIMMADDQRFVALNVKSNRMADNANATGKGFVAGLDLMVSGLEGQKVLVIGCGSVGGSAAMAALQRGARVAVFDINSPRAYQMERDIYKAIKKKISIENNLDLAMQHYQLWVEASNAPGIIGGKHIHPETYIAAPGMPLGLTSEAVEKISRRLLHDPLQIGVAVMAVDAVLSRSVEDWRVMLPYGSYIAQVANPHPKTSQKPEPKKTPKEPDHRKTSKEPNHKVPPKEPKHREPPKEPNHKVPPKEPKHEPPIEPDIMGITEVSAPEPYPKEPKLEPPPPLEEPDEDIHEKTEEL